MAIAAIAGLATYGTAAAIAGTLAIGWTAALTAFAIGAGLSMVSRALMPAPDIGTQMGGRSVTARDAAHTRKVVYGRARIGGNIVYLESTGSDNKYIWLVVAVAGHEIDAFESVWFNDEKVLDGTTYQGSWASYASISQYKGDQTAADSALVSASSKWTTNHKLLDTAYMVVKLTYDVDQFASGLPNISAIVRGKKVLNTSNNTTAWSQNPALCVYDYLRDVKYGLGESVTNILTSSVTAAAAVCDEAITLEAGGTQPRYTMDGVVDTGSSIKSNISAMVGGMAGRLVYSAGKFEVHAGEYVSPSFLVDESNTIGEITIQTKQSRRNAFNGVKGVFLSEDDNYVMADYPAQISSSFATEDGEPIFLDMPLPFTVNNIRAQRLAKLALFRSRQQEAITIPCNLGALRFKIGDNINVSNVRMGYSNKVFEVVGYALDFTSGGEIVVKVEAIETASSIWDWQASDEEVYLGGGEVSLYTGQIAAPPTSFTAVASTATNADGNIVPQIAATWVASADAFVVRYEFQWSTDNNNWNSIDVDALLFTITPVISGQLYYTRIRSVNNLGIRSVFVTNNISATGDTTAPAAPTSLSATAGYKSISLKWTNPSDKDFSNVEVYRATSSGGTYAVVATVGGGYSATTEFLNGGLADATAFYYKFKSVDYSGNKSAFTAIVNATTNAAAINGTNGTNGSNGSNGTNGSNGAAGPRSAAGYLYYSVSGSQPSAPSASGSYNFSTGAFAGLTANWSRTPPVITGGDAAYWATSYFVSEATFGGTQTKTFSTPFSSISFNGLVTFSNLNNELADGSSGSEITTINGGLLKTGTIDVAQVNISGTTQSGFNMQSAGSGSRIKILHDKIEIYDGSLSTPRVKLGNLS